MRRSQAERKQEAAERERRNSQLEHDVEEAEKYGLSYGVYTAYKESGYLQEYIDRLKQSRKKRPEHKNVIESSLIGAGSKGTHYSLEGKRMC